MATGGEHVAAAVEETPERKEVVEDTRAAAELSAPSGWTKKLTAMRAWTLGMTLLAGFLIAAPPSVLAADHVVGGSMWSIPPSSNLYGAWASNRTFLVGDNLVFRFEMGFYNVVQVSRREYEDCTAEDPFRTFHAGPAIVPLDAAGVRYFICTVGNYCSLGVKLYVTIQNPAG